MFDNFGNWITSLGTIPSWLAVLVLGAVVLSLWLWQSPKRSAAQLASRREVDERQDAWKQEIDRLWDARKADQAEFLVLRDAFSLLANNQERITAFMADRASPQTRSEWALFAPTLHSVHLPEAEHAAGGNAE
jgi:hypothetical protein